MISIVDYGVGNIAALVNMFDHLGLEAEPVSTADELLASSSLVLPGVGAFDRAMKNLQDRGLVDVLNEVVVVRQTPVLGVCLGMQLLARRSEEGILPGLGWIAADVRRIPVPPGSNLKVPHIGWSDVQATGLSPLFQTQTADEEPERFYFDHGYHVICDNPADDIASVQYGSRLCCAVQHDHVTGVQFHPEKSHRFGMRLLRAWASNVPTRGGQCASA